MVSARNIAVTAIPFEPIHRETLMDTVAHRIEQLVRNGELKAGDRLPPEPGTRPGPSRKPRLTARSAKGLMYLGLIKSRPGDGTYIQSSLSRVLNQHFQWMILLNEVKHLEIYELRKIIEPEVAALAAKRATRADIERLEAALDGMAQGRGNPELFHALIFSFTMHLPRHRATPRFKPPCACCITQHPKLERQRCRLSMTGTGIGSVMSACSLVFAITNRNSPAKRCWKILQYAESFCISISVLSKNKPPNCAPARGSEVLPGAYGGQNVN